jgi:hypothetical protein
MLCIPIGSSSNDLNGIITKTDIVRALMVTNDTV